MFTVYSVLNANDPYLEVLHRGCKITAEISVDKVAIELYQLELCRPVPEDLASLLAAQSHLLQWSSDSGSSAYFVYHVSDVVIQPAFQNARHRSRKAFPLPSSALPVLSRHQFSARIK